MTEYPIIEWSCREKESQLGKTRRSMLNNKSVPPRFWAECMKAAAYIINRLPQARHGFVSAYEKLLDVKPSVSYF
jgi:hypothetical protein